MTRFLTIISLLSMITIARAQNQTVTDGSRTQPISFGAGPCIYNWTNTDPSIGLPATGSGDIAAFMAINKGNMPKTARIVATPERKGYAYIMTTSGVLTLLDLKTNKIKESLTIPYSAYGEAISPDGTKLYLTNPWGNEVAIVDALDYRTLGTVPLGTGSEPRGIALGPDGSKLYVTVQDLPNAGGLLKVIDAIAFKVIATIPVAANPLGVTAAADGKTVYVAQTGASKLAVVDITTNTITANIPVGFGPVISVPTRDGKLLYVSNTLGTTVSVISTLNNTVTATLDVVRKPSGIALTPDERYLYLVNNIESSVTIFDLQSRNVLKVIDLPGGNAPVSISLSPDGVQAYVVNSNGVISIINTATHTLTTSVPTPNGGFAFGNFMSAGVSCGSGPITIDITVKPYVPPKATLTGAFTGLSTTYGDASASHNISINGSDISAPVTITAPAGAQVSADGSNFSSSVILQPDANDNISNASVYVRLSPTAQANTYSADLLITGGGGLDLKQNIKGMVSRAALTLAAKPVTKKYGEVLTNGAGSTAFVATGLKNNEVISSVTVNYGSAAPATANANNYAGIAVARDPVGAGFTAANYTISEAHGDVIVERIPLEIKADDLSRQIGRPNPTLTATYKGFVNGEGPPQLTAQPTLTTDATEASPAAKYAITVSGAVATNYTITMLPGMLTVYNAAQNITIPNTFTPNGDGINDNWNIADLQYYPGCTICIFNRTGAQLYYSNGYARAWDGTSKGAPLPTGTYYYLIRLNSGEQRSGAVAIVR